MSLRKTSELTGAALDWAVAKCEGALGRVELELVNNEWAVFIPDLGCYFEPSTDWSQGGPIVERKNIHVLAPIVRRIAKERHAFPVEYHRAMIQRDENELAIHGKGPTPLTAAMRCYVASELGDEVDVPEELV